MKLFFLLILFFLLFPNVANAQLTNSQCTEEQLNQCLTSAYQRQLFNYVLENQIIDSIADDQIIYNDSCPVDQLKGGSLQQNQDNYYNSCWSLVKDTYIAQMQTSCGEPNICTVASQTVETGFKKTFIDSLVQYFISTGINPTNIPPTPIPNNTFIPTPTPTRNPEDPNLELSDVQIQMAKCGLRAANYQCCYPNAEISGSLPSGSFFNAIDKLWETIRETIESNAIRLNFFQSDISNSVTDGSNYPPDLCPRTEEGEREERFYNVADHDQWLDQLDKYSGSENITNYENFLYGTASDAGVRDFKTDGLVGAIYSSTALPLMTSDEGVTYQGATYNCVCVNLATELNKTPDYFQNLPTNTVNTNDSPSSLTDLNPSKLCRNIKDPRENAECMACVHGGKAQKNGYNWDWIKPAQTPNTDLGGAWTAVGCIKADFSSTLQDTLFPLFISLGGLISLGCIIYASFLLQTSMGEPEKITKAQELMTSCITGLIVIIFSVFILRVIGVDILRLPGLDQEVLTPTPTVSPTTESQPSSSNSSSTTSITSSTPAFTITAPLLATSSPTITPTPTPIVFINNAIIYQENGTIFTTTPIPVSIIVGKYENTNKNYTLFQLNIDDQPNKKFYTKKENLLSIPTITGLPTVIHPFKCNTKIGSNEIQIYDDNINNSSGGGACAKLTLEEDESIFDLSKLKHDEMNEEWWRPRCDDNFEDCIASFKLGSGVKAELHRSRDCKDSEPLSHSAEGKTIISEIDTNWFWASYTDSISCIKLIPNP